MIPEQPDFSRSPAAAAPAPAPSAAAASDPDGGTYTLVGPDGLPYQDTVKGLLAGNADHRTYGRLTCPTATQALTEGSHAAHRVFFASEIDALAAGYRPCAVCLPYTHAYWAGLEQNLELSR